MRRYEGIKKMVRICILVIISVLLVGCGEDSSTETIESSTMSVPTDSYITLEDNQTIGYTKGSNVNIVNNSDGSYYVYCPEGECDVTLNSPVTTTTSTVVESTDTNDSNISK